MLERENEIILQTLIDRTIGRRNSCNLETALRADIPRPVKVYLQAEIEHWLERDLRASARFSRLDDQAAPYVDHVTRTYLGSVASAYRFTREEFLATLQQTVQFVENYLCRPQWTLGNFLFGQSEFLLLHEFRSKLHYVSEYRYFVTLLERTAKERGWTEIEAPDVRELIQKIDEKVVRQHSPRELAYLARPIYSFLLFDSDPFSKPVSLRPLLVFLEDKQLLPLRDHIKETCLARAQVEITLNELADLIEGFFLQKGAHTEATHQPPPVAANLPIDVSAPDSETPTPDAATASVHEDLSAPNNAEALDNKSRSPESHSDEDQKNVTDDSGILPGQSENGATTVSPAQQAPFPLLDLQAFMTYEQRQRFVKKLFGDDEAYYTVVLSALNGMPTWNEASLYLNDFFEINSLDPYADAVTEFTDFIHQRYSAERGEGS